MADQASAPFGGPCAPPLSPAQVAFLVSLLSGPRPTADCHDAVTVGTLMRLNLVAWHDGPNGLPGRRDRNSMFGLTEAAVRLLSQPAEWERGCDGMTDGPCPG